MLSFSLNADNSSWFQINLRPVIDDIDRVLPWAKKRNHIMICFRQGIQPEDKVPVFQSIGLDTSSYATFMLEQDGSDYVIGVQSRGLSKDQCPILWRFFGTGSQQNDERYKNLLFSYNVKILIYRIKYSAFFAGDYWKTVFSSASISSPRMPCFTIWPSGSKRKRCGMPWTSNRLASSCFGSRSCG